VIDPSVTYFVALFNSVSHVIKAERLLKEAKIPHKIIPVPKNISTDCGVCVRFLPEYVKDIKRVLENASCIPDIRKI
jgi:hypothetical protein